MLFRRMIRLHVTTQKLSASYTASRLAGSRVDEANLAWCRFLFRALTFFGARCVAFSGESGLMLIVWGSSILGSVKKTKKWSTSKIESRAQGHGCEMTWF